MIKWFEGAVIENIEISQGIYKLLLTAQDIVSLAKPGQFVNVYNNSEKHLLPRPISICEINKEKGTLTLVYAVVGKGTNIMSQILPGESIKLMGPLGNGFDITDSVDESILVGGGVGVPPLLELAKQLKGKTTVYLGFRTSTYLIEEFEKYCDKVYISTEDGSEGTKGNVLDLLNVTLPKGRMVFSCGPKPMLKAVYNWAKEKSIPTQLSFEERMACGIGACLVCTCKTQNENENDWENRRVCKDGPVFFGDEVVWDD